MTSLVLTHSNSRFLHLPKTGGAWILKCLEYAEIDFQEIDPERKIRGGHTGYYYNKERGFSFSFIRNPFDWYRSLFKFNIGTQTRPEWEQEDINKFVRDMTTSGHSLFEISKYFFGYDYEISFIGKYENLYEDLIDSLNFAIELNVDEEKIREYSKRVTNSTHKIMVEDYTTETKNLIYSADSYIFRRFKY